MSAPRLLDLFCGAGGAAMGYHRAGFEVVGVDIKPQPHYPFAFHQADALEFPLDGFDVIHASPPCQKFSAMTRGRWSEREHPDHIATIRARLFASRAPYVIENVVGAPLRNPMILCGTMFGLQTRAGAQLWRHRMFECPWWFDLVPQCQHSDGSAIGVYGGGQHPGRRRPPTGHVGTDYGVVARREAMGIDWMNGRELSEAVPPIYTEYIGKKLLAFVKALRLHNLFWEPTRMGAA